MGGFETALLPIMVAYSSLRALYALLVSVSLLSVLCAADVVGDLQTKGRPAIDAAVAKSTTCTKDKLRVRREWYVPSPSLSTHIFTPNSTPSTPLTDSILLHDTWKANSTPGATSLPPTNARTSPPCNVSSKRPQNFLQHSTLALRHATMTSLLST